MSDQNGTAIIMEVWAKDRDDLIASFTWSPDNGGHTVITFAKEDFGKALHKFIADGLGEWITDEGKEVPRFTLSNDAYFLPYLAAHIRRLSGMRTQLSWPGRAQQ